METKKHLNTKNMVLIAVFGALAAVLMLIEIPVTFIVPEFIKLDFSDVPIMLGTLAMGPVEGIFIGAIKIGLKLLLKPSSTMYVGELANFLCAMAFVLSAALIYHFKRTKKGAIVALSVGTITVSIVSVFLNAYLNFPFFAKLFHIDISVLVAMGTAINSHIDSLFTMMLFSVLPFNIMKYALQSIIVFVLYKRVRRVVFGVDR